MCLRWCFRVSFLIISWGGFRSFRYRFFILFLFFFSFFSLLFYFFFCFIGHLILWRILNPIHRGHHYKNNKGRNCD
ncbi:hypothetical protein D0469_06455 [Peribacillus saganii]|uniref:Uncharacterized protein n=1 Tax=Peribacillus saganii TaxID=2303992 RepID=A0A372LSP5_9BACI|nr:hypothetical protein D0469_06455 [Peribacillus saganii]